MDIKSLDNFKTLIVVLVLVAVIYLIMVGFKKESFEVPAPATLIKTPEPIQVPRIVSPSGPNPPNARIPEDIAKQNDIYNVIPNDPQDELYGSQNIKDNLRYPERLFGPGVVNLGNKILANSGVASTKILNTSQPIQPFSVELVQNGGMLGQIGPDDTHTNPNYASF